ncbi:MAG TPA: oxidoreductase [Candidatus Acidoferrum sp.]|jgi:scyllo-inositol 2-dehydrogenase (NADP+)
MIDVGVVGFGLGGRAFHAPIIHAVPGLRLAAIVERSRSSAREIYPDAKIVRDIEELLAIKSISLVAIATPNETHFPFAKRCLEAGRHVVADKPFTSTLAEALELVALARKHDRVLTVYQDRRFDGDFRTVQELLARGSLGKIVRFESAFDRCRPQIRTNSWKEKPAPGSGVFFDLGPHLVDQALQLFGPPEHVLADIRIEREGSLTEDAFDVTLYYKNGLRAILTASMLAPDPRPHYRIQGTRGAYVKHTLDPQEALLRADHPATGDDWGVEPEKDWGTMTLWGDGELAHAKVPTLRGDYRDFYAQVRDAIEGRAIPPVTPEQALRLMYTLELCVESSRKRAPLPWAFSA